MSVAEQVLKKVEEGSTYTEAQRAPKRQTLYTLLEQQVDIRRKLLDSMPERDELKISLPADRVRELMGDVAGYASIASEATASEYQALNDENSRLLPPTPRYCSITQKATLTTSRKQSTSTVGESVGWSSARSTWRNC